MKKLLTIVICGRPEDERTASSYDEVELIYTENNEAGLAEYIKQAKGKYLFIAPRYFELNDVKLFIKVLNECDDEIVSFAQGAAAKTTLFKGLNFKENDCAFLYNIFAGFSAKSAKKYLYAPVKYNGENEQFDDGLKDAILIAGAEFKKVKAKLSKDVYTYVSDLLIKKLTEFYVRALLAIREGNYDKEALKQFDAKLKGEIVLYLALEKRFPAAKLQKIREKGFKITAFTAKKLKKTLKKDA